MSEHHARPTEDVGPGRRRLLKYVAAGTGGLGAAAVLPDRADAATGDAVKAGFDNTASQMTVHRLTNRNNYDAGLLSTDTAEWSQHQGDYSGYALAGIATGLQLSSGVFGTGRYGVTGETILEDGSGVVGQSVVGTGVTAVSTAPMGTAPALLVAGNGLIRRDDAIVAVPPTAGTWTSGDLLNKYGDSWVCVASGSPGVWRKLAGPDSAGTFHHRSSTTPAFDSTVATTAKLALLSVPVGTTGVALTITAVDPAAAGSITVWQGGTAPRPSFRFAAGATVSTSCQVKISPNRRVSVVASTPTRVQLDLQGYYL